VQVKMQLFDRALLGVPAAAGAIHFLWLKVNALLTIGVALLVLLGLRKEKVAWQEATAALLTLGFLVLFAGRQWGRFLGRRDALHRRLAEHLQTCTLDTGVGVFLHLVDQAAEEEAAEAILAYAFLLRAGVPVALAELDQQIETWLQQKCGRSIDFEEDDALGKLERLQLVLRDDEGRISAVPLDAALAAVRVRWQGLIEGKSAAP
jgi:hypothetical protein